MFTAKQSLVLISLAALNISTNPAQLRAANDCVRDGIQRAVPQYAKDVEQFLVRCAAEQGLNGGGYACVEELGVAATAPVSRSGDRRRDLRRTASVFLREASHRFHRAILEACAGPDEIEFTDDDATLDNLDPGSVSGLRLHPWGGAFDTQMHLSLSLAVGGAPGTATFIQSHRESDCVTNEPVDVWMRKPGLQRLVEAYHCLATTQGLTMAAKRFAIPARRVQQLKLRAANPIPFDYDGGADRLPLLAPDGINDGIAVPEASGCPLPGLGVCAGDPLTSCSLVPGSGVSASPADCGAAGPCIENLIGPDGITLADQRRGHIGDMTVLITAADATEDRPPETHYGCFVRDVTDATGTVVSTQLGGYCDGGLHAGSACTSSADCDSQTPPRYPCVSGDEYVCHCNEIVAGNLDHTPDCGAPCLAAVVSGPPGAGCARASSATCAIAQCAGGTRDGQACDDQGRLDCPGGTCAGIGGRVMLTGDEAGFFVPGYGGMLYSLCPFQHRWDFPFDLVRGTGWVTTNIQDLPRRACLPPGTISNQTVCYIHAPAAGATDVADVIGFFTGPIAQSARKIPCPNVSVPLFVNDSGLSSHVGLGPILAVTGTPTP